MQEISVSPKELPYGPVTIKVTMDSGKRRLDLFLHSRFPTYSRSRLQALIRKGAVTVNDEVVKPSYHISRNDMVRIELPEDHHRRISPESVPLDILYEDKHLIAINKQPGMVVHPARGNWSGTLVNALLHHCTQLSNVNDPCRPGVVHRLDQYTSGIIICAKSDDAYHKLGIQFENRTTQKEYLAITDGVPQLDGDEIDLPLGKDPRHRERRAVRLIDGKNAITRYQVLERYDDYAYLSIRPLTGRTHQIRVHLKSIDCPVLCDKAYSRRSVLMPSDLGYDGEMPILNRQALHAYKLTVTHPFTDKLITFEAPLREDLKETLDALKACNKNRA